MHTHYLSEKGKGRDDFGFTGVDWRIILRMINKIM
jgi:hypothetical protein